MRAIRYNGNILTFAGKILRMAEWVYQEGIHYLRVLAGSGVTKDRNLTEDIYKMEEEYSFPPTLVGVLSESGRVERASGIYRFASKLFSLAGSTNDVVQATANSQPYLFKKGIKNVNGGSRSATHPAITFTGSDNWTLSAVINWNGTVNAIAGIFGKGSDTASLISLRLASNNRFSIINESATTVSGAIGANNRIIGKRTLLHFVANGTSLAIYAGSTLIETLTVNTNIVLSSIIKAYSTASRDFHGTINYYFVRSGGLDATQRTAEYNLLRSYFPEISTVQVGSKHIATDNCEMVATPKGNVIALNNTASNVNGIAGGNFEGGLIGVKNSSDEVSTWTLNTVLPISGTQDGRLLVTTAGTSGIRPRLDWGNARVIGKWYKTTFDYKVNSGICTLGRVWDGLSLLNVERILTGTGNFTYYYQAQGASNLYFTFDGKKLFDLQIDNVKDEEVGFAGAADLYTAIYNQTSGTVAQKTLAALKAAAMWRSPDSDLDKQAVFGKLFNKYANKLMKLDIDTYNTENPTATWGYHVMTRAEAQALDALDANTLKATGTDLWTTANGTNTTGLDVYGAGVINADGTYSNFKTKARLMTDDDYALDINDDGTSAEIAVTTEGGSLRLVKD